jgi:hypothetical protein
MSTDLLQRVETTTLPADEITARLMQIHAAVLSQSSYINDANFKRIHASDLAILFAEYDKRFFAGQIKEALGTTRLDFGLSKRMTSAGGKTAAYRDRRTSIRWYEISVSTTLLFGCFADDDHRPITASGITCVDRLDALQRVMEHEITHLVEILLWDKSSCAADRFCSITQRFFGHTENKHQLITPKERALVKFGIHPGMHVRFRIDGQQHVGVVKRINKRATVLVEDAKGLPYSNGKRYSKFYVPVQMLEKVE